MKKQYNGLRRAALIGLGALGLATVGTVLYKDPEVRTVIPFDRRGIERTMEGAGLFYQEQKLNVLEAILLDEGYISASSNSFRGADGDLDADGDIDLADYFLFVNCYSGPGKAVGKDCYSADFDRNGVIGLEDAAKFQRAYKGEEPVQ